MDSQTTFATTMTAEEKAVESSDSLKSSGSLYPILPNQTGRYDVTTRQDKDHATVEAGMYMAARTPLPQYLPEQWSACVHPEGKMYFCRNAQLRVVTDAYLFESQSACDKVVRWVERIEKLYLEKGFLFSDNIELFIQTEEDTDDCSYYFADHAARALFWLHGYETSELGLLPVVGSSHLRLQLEESYWNHLEYFCMHHIELDSTLVEDLVADLTHGCGDHLTSQDSTFPYTVKECEHFLKLLMPFRDRSLRDGKVIQLVGRLNGVITANRFWTNHGQEQARLSRSAAINLDQPEEYAWTQSISSAVSFGVSGFFHTRLSNIFTDEYVYEMHWRRLMVSAVRKWRLAFAMSLGLLMLHVFCFYISLSSTLAIASGSCLALSMVSAGLLTFRFEDEQEGSAGEAHLWLKRNRLPKIGFQATALVFASPQALNLWGTFFMVSQALTFVDGTLLAYCMAAIVVAFASYKVLRLCSRGVYKLLRRSKSKPETSTV